MLEKPVTKSFILTADKSMCYTRVVNSILSELPDNYEHLEDVFELKELCEELDRQLRKL